MIQLDLDAPLTKESTWSGWTGDDQWSIAPECDIGWWTRAREWGGGFFHHPFALDLGGHAGSPVVATCVDSVGVAAVAVGLRWRCRLSSRPRHVYFPSLPIVRPGVEYTPVMRSLCEALAHSGVSDISCDSFDAPGDSRGAAWGEPGVDRAEYRVMLDAAPEQLLARLSSHHVRLLHRGEKEGWEAERSISDDAVNALALVSQSATVRAAARGNPFTAAPWRLERAREHCSADWGVHICRVTKRGTLLAASLIGWGGGRAFYLGGGSTPYGYECGAATWMHWRTMLWLRERGITCYNLGGAPADAHQPTHPAHGLHRFKTGFGAGRITLRGLHWSDGSVHNSLHRAAQRLGGAHHADTSDRNHHAHAS
ncbi:MAG TPA: GNAT family N-acetyltransferase [Gemmatimonadaceae bacterium]